MARKLPYCGIICYTNVVLIDSEEKRWLQLAEKPLALLAQKPRTAQELAKALPEIRKEIPDILSWLEYRGMVSWADNMWHSVRKLNFEQLLGFVAGQYDLSPLDILHGGSVGRHVVARDHVVGLARIHGWGVKELARVFDRDSNWVRAAQHRFKLRLQRVA